MAIKFSTGEGLGLPEKLVSASGSWTSAPESGGIITFSGNAVLVDDTPFYGTGDTFKLGSIGSFIITSVTTDTYLGYSKVSLSLTDILGSLGRMRTSSRLSKPLVHCVNPEKGSTINELISSINTHLGINFSLPRTTSNKIYESIWAKDGQDLVSLLNEILVAHGCILYSDGPLIKCETVGDFFRGLKGKSNSNTISSSFNINGTLSATISDITISGAKQEKKDLPKTITQNKTTIKYLNREIETINESPDGRTKNVTKEKYEAKPSGAISNGVTSINDCYPIDNARILERINSVYYRQGYFEESVYNAGIKTGLSSCNLPENQAPLTFATIPSWVLVEETSEYWDYDTTETTIQSSPTSQSKRETVKYSKTTGKNLAVENINECSITYGFPFEFLEDPDDAKDFFNTFYNSKVLGSILTTTVMERETINWVKEAGSKTWVGTRYLQYAKYKTSYEKRRAYIEDFFKALNRGDESISTPDNKTSSSTNNFSTTNFVGDTFSQTGFFSSNLANIDYATFKTNYSSILSGLENNLSSLEVVSSEEREDWNPQFSTFPSNQKIENIPWEKTLNTGAISGSGDNLSLRGGRFSDEGLLQAAAREIKNARQSRQKSLSITNINEIFKVGQIDAPSFSIDSNGVKTSGVYLNG